MKSSSLLVVFLPSLVLAHEAGHASSSAPEASDYVVKLSEMTAIEAGKGERIHLLNGREHGFESLSFILTETAPGGGPPLHTHESEEAHVLTSGTIHHWRSSLCRIRAIPPSRTRQHAAHLHQRRYDATISYGSVWKCRLHLQAAGAESAAEGRGRHSVTGASNDSSKPTPLRGAANSGVGPHESIP
jgi:hypothetical protein